MGKTTERTPFGEMLEELAVLEKDEKREFVVTIYGTTSEKIIVIKEKKVPTEEGKEKRKQENARGRDRDMIYSKAMERSEILIKRGECDEWETKS